MASQEHLLDKLRDCAFVVQRKVAHVIMQARYDKVYKSLGADMYSQSYPDLPHVSKDEQVVKRSTDFIGGFEFGPNDCFWVNKDLKNNDMQFKELITASVQLVKLLNKHPDEKFFHITFVAGHGMHFEKSHCILLNVFDK